MTVQDLTAPLEEVRTWAACISQSIQNGVAALAEELSIWSGDNTPQSADRRAQQWLPCAHAALLPLNPDSWTATG